MWRVYIRNEMVFPLSSPDSEGNRRINIIQLSMRAIRSSSNSILLRLIKNEKSKPRINEPMFLFVFFLYFQMRQIVSSFSNCVINLES